MNQQPKVPSAAPYPIDDRILEIWEPSRISTATPVPEIQARWQPGEVSLIACALISGRAGWIKLQCAGPLTLVWFELPADPRRFWLSDKCRARVADLLEQGAKP